MERKVSIPFIDANVIMYTVGKEHKYKEPCSLLVRRIAEENIVVASDTEVLQEILYRYWLIREFKRARETYNDFKSLISLMLPVTIDDVSLALELLERYRNIQPRDAIHSAVMLNNGLTRIYSTDAHFDEIKEIERIDPIDPSLKRKKQD
ncbi:MAG: type II toxin-antitoxin system VapC family toxin [Candidatus Aerophobetes bacterium]|nr:type II toxin-antitoxin system VapC family toxin [Candidatus Aerophobetes bacterium]